MGQSSLSLKNCFKLSKQTRPPQIRIHDLDISIIKELQENSFSHPSFDTIAANIKNAKKTGAAIILMLGGHVVRSGTQRYIIDLMEQGYITCLAMNGSGVIHDFELALIGATTWRCFALIIWNRCLCCIVQKIRMNAELLANLIITSRLA